MGDDGIGSLILKELSPRLTGDAAIFLYGETDVDYILDHIQAGDFLILLDAAYTGRVPGSVTVTSIRAAAEMAISLLSQHQSGLLPYLSVLRPDTAGYIIGIEAGMICFGTELSKPLKERFPDICEAVYAAVKDILRIENIRYLTYTDTKRSDE